MALRLREREEWRFFGALRQASGGLAAAWWCGIVLRGLLPAALAVASGALVAAVARDQGAAPALLTVGVVFVAMQVLPPLHVQVAGNLGDRMAAWLNDRLLAATLTPDGLAHLEAPETNDDLAVARDFDLGLSGPPLPLSLSFVAGGLVEMVAGTAQAAVLFAYHWWAPFVVGGAWAATHWLLRGATVWDRTTGEVRTAQRHANYTYRLATDAPAAKEVRLFGLAPFVVDTFAGHRRRLVDLRWAATRLARRPMWWTLGLLVTSNGVFFWTLSSDAAAGRIGLAEAVTFAQAAVGASLLAFGGLNWALPLAASAVAAVDRLGVRAEELGGLPDGDRPADRMPAVGIRLRDVRFTYASGRAPVFDGLNLDIPAGSSMAVVGVNGAGKTTLVKLLCRLYDPDSGAIEVDGTDLRRFRLASWRRRVAAVFQDFIRYELPMRDNVAPLGGTDEELAAALRQSGADDLADLDTVLSVGYDGGTDLSGGQWQRVALARVLHAVRRGAGVVILDEPTAQLDVRGEAAIFERLLEATRGRTTILISHRFSTVRHADRICVLEAGRVAELGGHDELMALGGRYRTMFDLQAARFTDEDPDELVEA